VRDQFFIILKSYLHRNKHLPQAMQMQPFSGNFARFCARGSNDGILS
jgi:hypothetical protein